MRHGFIKVAAATPDIRVADVDYNKGQIIKQMDEAAEAGAKIIVFRSFVLQDIHAVIFSFRIFY